MKKRFLAFLLAVCVAVSMLVLPASAVGSNAAVQTATALGGLTAEQAGSLGAPLTRGQAARLLTAFSAYRDTTTAQGRTGRLYSDVDSDSPYAVYIRTAVQNGWMTGYSDGSFRPDNTVTLEEACTMALRLLGYDVAKLGGTFPTAQLSKASALGLRNEINARQGETLTLEQGTMLFYNALTAMNGSGQVYASTLGFAVSNGQVDISSVLLDNVKGPFVADASTVLPFAPAAIYRNDEVTTSAALSPYDVYYYNESARTVWIYNKRAAGRVTAVSPSASAPTSVTVAGVTYTIASPSVAYQLSSLSGGGVGQVVTLLLGMNDAAVSVLTGDAADAVFYGVVQSSSRTLVETNSAEVQQAVSVMCTDGTARTVNVDNKLNFPAGKLVEISVDGDGESVQSISPRSTSGTVSADGTALGDTPFADNVQIIDTTSEGVAGAVRPSRLSGVTLSESDVRYYTTNSAGQIDRVILDDVTGDLWEYAALDSVRRLTDEAAKKIDKKISDKAQDAAREAAGLPAATTTTTTKVDKTDEETFQDVKNILVPSTSDVLYGLIDGSVVSSTWNTLTGKTGQLFSYVLRRTGDSVGGTLGDFYSRIDLKRDSNGAVYINEKGEIASESITDVNSYIKLGSVLPDANMAWRNDFRWRNFNFGFMVSARLGGVVFSRTQAMLDYYGVSEVSAAARDAGGVMINGGDLVDANKWYTAIGSGNSVPQYYTYSATNVRLQEASIGYTIPKKKLGDICEITLSLVGRNLWMIYNKAPYDPETVATVNSYYQGIDYFMSPSTRNIGFNLRLKF